MAVVCTEVRFPLHLMYNSAVFETLEANTYNVLTVTKDFYGGQSDSNWNHTLQSAAFLNTRNGYPGPDIGTIDQGSTLDLQTGSLDRLKRADCIKAYSNPLQTRYRSVIVITPINASDSSVLNYTQTSPLNESSLGWLLSFLPGCIGPSGSSNCTITQALASNSSWLVMDCPVDSCMVERVPEMCKSQFSLPIMIAVIECDIIKFICMVLTIVKDENTFVTVSDVLSSYLAGPEAWTAKLYLLDKKKIILNIAWIRQKKKTLKAHRYRTYRHFWCSAVSPLRWFTWAALSVFAWVNTVGLFINGVGGLQNNFEPIDIKSLAGRDFGTVDVN